MDAKLVAAGHQPLTGLPRVPYLYEGRRRHAANRTRVGGCFASGGGRRAAAKRAGNNSSEDEDEEEEDEAGAADGEADAVQRGNAAATPHQPAAVVVHAAFLALT